MLAGYLSGARCKRFAYGPADATATPITSCFVKVRNGLTFQVPVYPDRPGKEAVNRYLPVDLVIVGHVARAD